MRIHGDLIGLILMWLVFTGLVMAYVARIAWLLYQQSVAEHALRFRYAAARGAAAREARAIAHSEANQ